MKYHVWYEGLTGKKDIGDFDSKEEALQNIYEILEEKRVLKVYYIRLPGVTEKTTMVDYGSHSNFFYIEEVLG